MTVTVRVAGSLARGPARGPDSESPLKFDSVGHWPHWQAGHRMADPPAAVPGAAAPRRVCQCQADSAWPQPGPGRPALAAGRAAGLPAGSLAGWQPARVREAWPSRSRSFTAAWQPAWLPGCQCCLSQCQSGVTPRLRVSGRVTAAPTAADSARAPSRAEAHWHWPPMSDSESAAPAAGGLSQVAKLSRCQRVTASDSEPPPARGAATSRPPARRGAVPPAALAGPRAGVAGHCSPPPAPRAAPDSRAANRLRRPGGASGLRQPSPVRP